MKSAIITLLLCASFSLSAQAQRQSPARNNGTYVATAYSVTGITASGEWTHRHVIAADPDILPIGSRVKVKWAGKYSGEYVVADTGAKIQGRRLDIYMPSEPECKKFGVKRVRIQLISLGAGTHEAAKQADQAVKADVAKDVSKGAVGNAATETDWNAQGKAKAEQVKADADATPVPKPATTTSAPPQ